MDVVSAQGLPVDKGGVILYLPLAYKETNKGPPEPAV
jgi:hypothetical protein